MTNAVPEVEQALLRRHFGYDDEMLADDEFIELEFLKQRIIPQVMDCGCDCDGSPAEVDEGAVHAAHAVVDLRVARGEMSCDDLADWFLAAVRNGCLGLAQHIASAHGINPAAGPGELGDPDLDELPPLFHAVRSSSNKPIVSWLVDVGADLAAEADGTTLLCYACECDSGDMPQWLAWAHPGVLGPAIPAGADPGGRAAGLRASPPAEREGWRGVGASTPARSRGGSEARRLSP